MAPNKQEQGKGKKVAEDKTFGLKNKAKSKAVRQFTESIQKQQAAKAPVTQNEVNKAKKQAEEARQKEINELFVQSIKQPKIAAGVDPKSVLCEHFRHGQCSKGFKCKYSHDLEIERKRAKIDLFCDQRNLGGEEENMEDWDQEKLEQVIRDKHAAEQSNQNTATAIICKFFLDAVEKRAYGWFWKCPNGNECKYRHALPPGFIMKSQMKELIELERANMKDVAELIEEERAKVDAKTPITEEVFKAWHNGRQEERRRLADQANVERRKRGNLNGREIFLQDGFEATDDDGAADDYGREGDEEAQIRAMLQAARETEAKAREAAAAAKGEPSSSGGAGPSSAPAASTLKLDAAEEDLFMDEDDEDEEDDDEEDLDGLEAGIKTAHLNDGED